jgi:lysine decarboxylase
MPLAVAAAISDGMVHPALRIRAPTPALRSSNASLIDETPSQVAPPASAAVAACAAHGRISAEVVAPYPPGIPVIAPGERIEAQVVAALRADARRGTRIAYCRSPNLDTIQVIRDRR